jgi:hypothetical protein
MLGRRVGADVRNLDAERNARRKGADDIAQREESVPGYLPVSESFGPCPDGIGFDAGVPGVAQLGEGQALGRHADEAGSRASGAEQVQHIHENPGVRRSCPVDDLAGHGHRLGFGEAHEFEHASEPGLTCLITQRGQGVRRAADIRVVCDHVDVTRA